MTWWSIVGLIVGISGIGIRSIRSWCSWYNLIVLRWLFNDDFGIILVYFLVDGDDLLGNCDNFFECFVETNTALVSVLGYLKH